MEIFNDILSGVAVEIIMAIGSAAVTVIVGLLG